MKNFMFVFVIAMLCVPAIAKAQPLAEGEASALVCGPGEIQVCTEPDGQGGFSAMFRRGSPLYDCSVPSDRGVGLRCKVRDDVCSDAKILCEQRNDSWEWNESDCRCDFHRATPPSTPTPPTTPPTRTTPPTPACPDCDQCSISDLQQIAEGLDVIERRIGQLEVLVEEEVRETLFEAVNLREQANECRDEILAERATIMAAALEERLDPEAHDYHDEFDLVHQHLDALDFTVENDENWCTDTFGGVLTCIVLPTVAAGAAIFLGVYYGTEWSATQE